MVLTQVEWLIDKSALVRLKDSFDANEWASRIDRGLVRITAISTLEVGYSARSSKHWNVSVHDPPVGNMPVEYLTPRAEERAVEVQGLLAGRGHHRAAKIPDLLIAATAELADLTVLHVDKDFDLIADVTEQSVERLRLDPSVST